jgi:hypothetical protein
MGEDKRSPQSRLGPRADELVGDTQPDDSSNFRGLFLTLHDSWHQQDFASFGTHLQFLFDGYQSQTFSGLDPTFYELPIDEILFACLSDPDFAPISLTILCHICPVMLMPQACIDALVQRLLDLIRNFAAVPCELLIGCFTLLRILAKRGGPFSEAVRSRLVYSLIIEFLKDPGVVFELKHSIVDLLVLFGQFALAAEHAAASIEVAQTDSLLCDSDRIRFIWWLLGIEPKYCDQFDAQFLADFLTRLITEPETEQCQRFAVKTVARTWPTLPLPFDYSLVISCLDPEHHKISRAAIECIQTLLTNDEMLENLAGAGLLGSLKFLLSDQAPFVNRKLAVRLAITVVAHCPDEAKLELLDGEIFVGLVQLLEPGDAELIEHLLVLFAIVIGKGDPPETEVGQHFLDLFREADGWAIVEGYIGDENVPLNNAAVEFYHRYYSEILNEPEFDE